MSIDPEKWLRGLAVLLEKGGTDAAIWLIVAVGGFGALWLKQPADDVLTLCMLFTGGWLANKAITVYLQDCYRKKCDAKNSKPSAAASPSERPVKRRKKLPSEHKGDDEKPCP